MKKYIIIAVLAALTLCATACSTAQEPPIDPQAYADLQAQVEQLNNDIADMQGQLAENEQIIADNEQELAVKDDTIAELQTELDDCASKQAESVADELDEETADELTAEETLTEPPVQETAQPEPQPEVEQKPEPEPEKPATTTNSNQVMFEGYPITVLDWETPATNLGFAGGLSTSAFEDATGRDLATMPSSSTQAIMEAHNNFNNDYLIKLFNDFRNTGSGSTSTATDSNLTGDDVTDALYLINVERKANGLNAVTLDTTANDWAQTRATELSDVWGHTRPNGTRLSQTHYYYEIITSGALTAEEAIGKFIDSSEHYDIILENDISIAGIGRYKNYWCILFQ